MRGLIKKFFVTKPEDPFLTLMAVAREEETIRERLLTILDQRPLERQQTLERWIIELEAQETPEYFRKAVGFLLNDATAQRAFEVLQQR
ncbi:MAG TPA: hypothetical protein DCM54_05735 [Gammaproteobacteria bacterium]|nr:hypothetical protein [Gammaproteobacteria bacterium]|tara:strand:+ start:469 stop:735 length:267 start_codon:yes stop_codon:yes gene_type:complete